MDRTIRAALASTISLATMSFALSGVFVGVTTLSASAAFDAYLKFSNSDGKQGQVTEKSVNGKTVYIMTLNGKPAAPGMYTVSGHSVKVVGPDGLVDHDSFVSCCSRIMLNPQPLPP
jgi:hypothetical protein